MTRLKNNTIQFILDNEIVTIDFSHCSLAPTTTLLTYLRSLPDHKGVKEGCAEGDCGACTVVIAEQKHGTIHYKAVNSCLVFLPMIHGKQVITVENLAHTTTAKELQLHPVQTALIEADGTQCGFCTPGVVMSLFGLYKNIPAPDRTEVEEHLNGNLCRCTGYQPMINAGASLPDNNDDWFTENECATLQLLHTINTPQTSISIETSSQSYFQPLTIDEALQAKETHPDAVSLSGSTDISLKQTKQFELLQTVIDLSAVDSLQEFTETDSAFIVGAGMTLESINEKLQKQLPVFTEMIRLFASKQIRNLATIGGNIASDSPINDTIPLLFALEANVILINRTEKKELTAEDFILGYRKTALQPNELIECIIIPKQKNNCSNRFYKVSKRKHVDISSVSAGFSLELEGNLVKKVILAYGGMAETTKRATKTENFLLGSPWNQKNIQQAILIVKDEFTPLSDVRAGADYRTMVAGNLLMKFHLETIA